jgi:Bacterial cell division membrane protein
MKKFKYMDKILLITTILLFLVGLLFIYSSSSVKSYMGGAAAYNYFKKQSLILLVSVVIAIIILKIPLKSFYSLGTLGFFISIILLFLLIPLGHEANQAKSWFKLYGFHLQPSELFKPLLVVFLAFYYDKYKNKLNDLKKVLTPIILFSVGTILIYKEPDLGTSVIVTMLFGIMFFASPIPRQMKSNMILGGLGLIVIALVFKSATGREFINERQKERLDFRRPCDRLLDKGNQVCNGYIALNNGGLFGVGLGNSKQKYLYLPEPHTDFIYAIIVEEKGAIGGSLIIVGIFIVIWRILSIAFQTKSTRNFLLCIGAASIIFINTAVNLSGLLGLLPETGVTLPFISYGGSSALSLTIIITAVQLVAIENNKEKGQ